MDAPLPTSAPAAPDAPAVDTTASAPATSAADAPPADAPPAAMESGPLEDEHGAIASEPAPAPEPQAAAPAVFERRSFGRSSADAPMVVTVH